MTQNEALTILKTGQSVFLTGEPGSGKTHTVNKYVSYLRSHNIYPAITASTGIAATHIGGMTIHSWSGIGIKSELTSADIEKICRIKRVFKNIKDAKVLIIDEISMISADTLNMVDEICKEIRMSDLPFGGMQVVFVGDFFQLPPVFKKEIYSDEIGARFAYESSSWADLNPTVCYLSEQYRQEDEEFIDILSAIRSGDVSDRHQILLKKRMGIYEGSLDKKITKLYSHNFDVDRINSDELLKLPGESRFFDMDSRGSKVMVEQLKRGCLSPENLVLKNSARVMFTKNNFEEGFVNGTTGMVVGFEKKSGYPRVKTDGGRLITVKPMEWVMESEEKTLASIIQIPLRLAWAITIHKSQGMSIDNAVIDLSRTFEYGQGYVALSRIRSLKGLYLVGVNNRAFQVCPEVKGKDDEFRRFSKGAINSLNGISDGEISKIHEDFIRDCGGQLEPLKTKQPVVTHIINKSKGKREEYMLVLLNAGKSIEGISEEIGVTRSTIFKYLYSLKESGKLNRNNTAHLMAGFERETEELRRVFDKIGTEKLKPIYEYVGESIPYDVIRLARILYENENKFFRQKL